MDIRTNKVTSVEFQVELKRSDEAWYDFPWSYKVFENGRLLWTDTAYSFRWWTRLAAKTWCRREAQRRMGTGRLPRMLRFTYRAERR